MHSLKQPAPVKEPDAVSANEVTLSGGALLAEDNNSNQQLLSMLLRKMGVTVSVAEYGEVAIKMA